MTSGGGEGSSGFILSRRGGDNRDSALANRHVAFYTVGQVADLLGVQQPFLRRLDAEDVVRPARSEGGQRRYTEHQIEVVAKVVELAAEGMTLAGIRRIFALEEQVRRLEAELVGYRKGFGRKE